MLVTPKLTVNARFLTEVPRRSGAEAGEQAGRDGENGPRDPDPPSLADSLFTHDLSSSALARQGVGSDTVSLLTSMLNAPLLAR